MQLSKLKLLRNCHHLSSNAALSALPSGAFSTSSVCLSARRQRGAVARKAGAAGIGQPISTRMQAQTPAQSGYTWEPWHPSMESTKRVSPAADRNKEPILQQLKQLLPPTGSVLEVASGTGQHVAYFAAALPGLQWQPSDVTGDCFDSIRAYAGQLDNVLPPLLLDSSLPPEQWPCKGPYAAVLAANVTHISPWHVTQGLVAGAAKVLQPGGLLFIYGPFKIDGAFTSESNEAFHRTLVSQNPEWGYRDAADVAAAAGAAGFEQQACISMPANNHALVFRLKQ